MKNNLIETIMGAVVLLIAAFFVAFVYTTSGYKERDGTLYSANFDRIDGLVLGSEVRMSGVKVGFVKTLSIDPQSFMATVTFTALPKLKLPKDSSAEIVSDGLMGNKYLALVPGGEDETLKPGGEVIHTQSSVSLEGMIGKFMFSSKDKKDKKKDDDPAPAPSDEAATGPKPGE